MANVICFHNPNEVNGYLSNWYLSNFIEDYPTLPLEFQGIKGVTYNDNMADTIEFTSMEQYMMFSKAMVFHDLATAKKILSTSDVAKIKQYGREVRNYDDKVWSDIGYKVVVKGLYCKFMQNPELLRKLKSTGYSILAECAVKDCKWGIGLSMTDARRLNPSQWRGTNLLGKALMEVRSKLV